MRAELDQRRQGGMTDKNLKLIREVMAGDNYRRLLQLPEALMRQAHEASYASPTKAAVLAQMAVAIRILCFAPVRLGNLAAIRLGENLIKPAGPLGDYRLVFPRYDVKNRVDLDFPFDGDTTALINAYVHTYRPHLLRGRNEDWLFPGEADGHKTGTTLSAQVTQRISRAIGLRITVHQFRHAAAAKLLEANPGNYELARRILGHRNLQTTIRNYIGMETAQATKMFGELVTRQAQKDLGR